jgi:hypothetical protein
MRKRCTRVTSGVDWADADAAAARATRLAQAARRITGV